MEIKEFKNYFEVGGLKCHWNFWLLPKRFLAITLFGHVFFNISKEKVKRHLLSRAGKNTIQHERIHTLQADSFKTKYLGFYLYYIAYWVRNLFVYGVKDIDAYRNIPFEREAFANDHLEDYGPSKWREYCDE